MLYGLRHTLRQTPARAYSAARLVSDLTTRGYVRLIALLDERVFPVVVSYSTHPFTIAATMLLLLLLLAFASNTILVLVANSYLNVCSAAVSSIVLMMSLKHHTENKRLHAQHLAETQRLHERISHLEANQQPAQPAQPTPTTPATPTAKRMTHTRKAAHHGPASTE